MATALAESFIIAKRVVNSYFVILGCYFWVDGTVVLA